MLIARCTDYGADTNIAPYVLPEFSYFFETAYDVTTPTFPTCTLDRPPGSNGDGLLPLINHFLDVDILGILVPDRSAAAKTVSKGSLRVITITNH